MGQGRRPDDHGRPRVARLLLRKDVYEHTYPYCWRCDTPLLYYAKPSWYIATSQAKDSLTSSNADLIHWHPEHTGTGRYGDWLANNVDWAVSRERYWGTPLPFWRCTECGDVSCIGSFDELRERAKAFSGVEPDLSDPHRPFVDEIEIGCEKCPGAARRCPEVADAWFDSGAMPYAQWHYPFENQDRFDERFPADFICEAVDQTRGWFYSLHAEAAMLHRAEAVPEPISFRHVISLGHILDEAGEKMSKSKGNVVDPWTVLDQSGADALRWYCYVASPAGNPRRFSPAWSVKPSADSSTPSGTPTPSSSPTPTSTAGDPIPIRRRRPSNWTAGSSANSTR